MPQIIETRVITENGVTYEVVLTESSRVELTAQDIAANAITSTLNAHSLFNPQLRDDLITTLQDAQLIQ